MRELSEFSAYAELAEIHEMCDAIGIPKNISPAARVLYYVTMTVRWMEFLKFLGYDISQGDTREETEPLVDTVEFIVGAGFHSGSRYSTGDTRDSVLI